MATIHEAEIAFLKRETGSASNNIQDLRKAYFDVKVPGAGSVADKELKYLMTKTGATSGSLTDLRVLYYGTVRAGRSANIKGGGNDATKDYFENAPGGS